MSAYMPHIALAAGDTVLRKTNLFSWSLQSIPWGKPDHKQGIQSVAVF